MSLWSMLTIRGGVRRALALIAAAATVTVISGGSVQASEGGGNHYFLGAANIMAGSALPPGDYFMTYTGIMSNSKVYDSAGNQGPGPFHADTEYLALRYLHRTDVDVLGGRWGYYVVLPFANASGRFGVRQQKKFGLGDLIIAPVALAWKIPTLHWAAGIDVTLPTGMYSRTDLVKAGRNYVGVMPNVAFTWLPGGGFELSSRLMTTYNTTNTATHYRSGREFMADYFAGFHLGERTVAGVSGYSYIQLTDDVVNGLSRDGTRGRAHGVGMALAQGFDGFRLSGSMTREYSVRNRPQANRGLLRLTTEF